MCQKESCTAEDWELAVSALLNSEIWGEPVPWNPQLPAIKTAHEDELGEHHVLLKPTSELEASRCFHEDDDDSEEDPLLSKPLVEVKDVESILQHGEVVAKEYEERIKDSDVLL